MEQYVNDENSVSSADIHVCIFPNLEDFMIIDVRDVEVPHLRLASAKELLSENYLAELEKEFGDLLRAEGPPFVNMMLLAARVQALITQRGMSRLLEMLSADALAGEPPRISLFVATGPILKMSDDDLSLAFDTFFHNVVSGEFAARCDATFKRLLKMEKNCIQEQHKDELRRAVRGESDQFFTLWQDSPPGGNFSAS